MTNHGRRTGERFLGKRIGFRRGSWIVLPLAIVAWFTPVSTAQATNILDNGEFNGSSGWTVTKSGGSGVSFEGALQFSYRTGEVLQGVPVSSGQVLDASFTVDNGQTNSVGQGAVPDTWTATLSSGEVVATVTRSVAHGLETFNLSITVPQGATTATITFSGIDNGYWAGNYGPTVDNVTLSATLPSTPANNGCGPYSSFTVTGSLGGTIWGSNPYTDDSSFAAAAVHAGLIVPGETAIIEPYLVDNYPSYLGSAANGVTTYDWGGSWCGYYIRVLGTPGATTTTTTTLAPYLNPPLNLSITVTDETSVYLSWDSPEPSNVEVERYAVFFSSDNFKTAFAVATVQNSITIGNLDPDTTYQFSVRADNDTRSVYSERSNIAEGATPPTTTTTTTTLPEETTTTWPESTTTSTTSTVAPTPSVDVPTTTVPATSMVPTQTTTSAPAPVTETTSNAPTTDAPVEENLPPETTVAEPEATDPETAPNTEPEPEPEPEQPTGDVTTEDLTSLSPAELADQLDDLSTEELTSLVEGIDEPDQLEALIAAGAVDQLDTDQLLSIIDNPVFTELSAEAFSEVLTSVFDEPLSDEQFDAIIGAVLDAPISDEQFDALVDALGGDSVTDEQVQAAVDQIIENGITEEFATSLATSADVLTSIDGDAASEIFAEVPVSDLTDDEAEQIVAAVQDAPEEVRESFETEINIFDAGSFDAYAPIGSAVDVGTRRVIIAATTVVSVLTVVSPPSSPAPASPNGSGSGSGGPSPSPAGSSTGSAPESGSSSKRRRLPGGR